MTALAGLLVVSLEQAVAAPLCTARLAAAGARVIKIERSSGDFARRYDSAAKGESSYFTWLNQGKESLVADIKDENDGALLRRILGKADVFVQNLAPGAAGRAGLGSAKLRDTYPSLITCDLSGYGTGESVRKLKAYDLLVQGESGLLSVSGPPGPYGRIGISVCDIGAGVTAYAAILEALVKRRSSGEGSAVSVSLFDVAAEWMSVPFVHHEYGSGAPERVGLKHPSIAPYGAFTTKDDQDVIIAIQNDHEWERLCVGVLQNGALANSPDFATNQLRVKNRQELDGEVQRVTGTLSAEELSDRLGAASIAYGRVNSVEELARHAALRRQKMRTCEGEDLDMPALPAQGLSSKPSKSVRSPTIGEHSNAIRAEFAD